jgi:2-hydroxychromene-2-carboxylate isomerase
MPKHVLVFIFLSSRLKLFASHGFNQLAQRFSLAKKWFPVRVGASQISL